MTEEIIHLPHRATRPTPPRTFVVGQRVTLPRHGGLTGTVIGVNPNAWRVYVCTAHGTVAADPDGIEPSRRLSTEQKQGQIEDRITLRRIVGFVLSAGSLFAAALAGGVYLITEFAKAAGG